MKTRAKRWDRAKLRRAQRLDNGWLKAPTTFTRAGIFVYVNSDGTIRRELRPPEEVFKADSLASLQLVPVTHRHPADLLDDSNTQQYQVGSAGDSITRNGLNVDGTVIVTKADAVQAVESGECQEVSCGYTCKMDMTPGEWQGMPYDAVQRNIRYNHVALEPLGRGGRDVRVHLDAADAVQADNDQQPRQDGAADAPEEKSTMKVVINGVQYDIDDTAAQALQVQQTRQDAELKAAQDASAKLKADNDALQARADAAEEAKEKAEAERNDALSPEKLSERVQARLKLEREASAVLGDNVKFDGLSDIDVKRKVVEASSKKVKLDGKSDDYIQARYDFAVEASSQGENEALAAVHKTAMAAPTVPEKQARKDAAERYDISNAWQEPLDVSRETA